jgi:hypothetical protein
MYVFVLTCPNSFTFQQSCGFVMAANQTYVGMALLTPYEVRNLNLKLQHKGTKHPTHIYIYI